MKSISFGSPVHILFISHDAALFGAQRMLLALLQGLDRVHFSPYLLVPGKGDLVDAVHDLGIPVFEKHLEHWAPCINMMKGRGRLSYLAHMLRGLRARSWAIARLIERHGIDLIYTNTVTCIEGAVAARMMKKPHLCIFMSRSRVTANCCRCCRYLSTRPSSRGCRPMWCFLPVRWQQIIHGCVRWHRSSTTASNCHRNRIGCGLAMKLPRG